jgi:hypothetical protein
MLKTGVFLSAIFQFSKKAGRHNYKSAISKGAQAGDGMRDIFHLLCFGKRGRPPAGLIVRPEATEAGYRR